MNIWGHCFPSYSALIMQIFLKMIISRKITSMVGKEISSYSKFWWGECPVTHMRCLLSLQLVVAVHIHLAYFLQDMHTVLVQSALVWRAELCPFFYMPWMSITHGQGLNEPSKFPFSEGLTVPGRCCEVLWTSAAIGPVEWRKQTIWFHLCWLWEATGTSLVGTSLVVQWVRLCAPNAGGLLGQETGSHTPAAKSLCAVTRSSHVTAERLHVLQQRVKILSAAKRTWHSQWINHFKKRHFVQRWERTYKITHNSGATENWAVQWEEF